MWAIASTRNSQISPRTNRLLLGGWTVFAILNVELMYAFTGQETVPFHFVWISLSIVYGFTQWRPLWMWLVLTAVAISTGYVLAHHASVGEIGWEELTEVPLMTALFIVLVWHVERRQQAHAEAARLAESERRRAETQQLFVQLAAHELRTPITIARGFTELAGRSRDTSVRGHTTVVLEELDKLTRITQRLVTLMQAQGPAAAEPIDIDAALIRIGRRWGPTARRAWHVSTSVGYAAVDPERLEAAVDSLLENAVKFTRDGDRIELLGRRAHDSWTVEVRDGGSGMTPEMATMLNDTKGPLPRTASGTGLGIAIARAVVTGAGGRLSVDSHPGGGAAFTLRFPGRPRDEAPVPAMVVAGVGDL
jgi:signal transduction histidine kinase